MYMPANKLIWTSGVKMCFKQKKENKKMHANLDFFFQTFNIHIGLVNHSKKDFKNKDIFTDEGCKFWFFVEFTVN